MPCVITWAGSFLTSEVVEAVRGQKYISTHALIQRSVHPTAPVLLTKDLIGNEISYDFQPPSSLHISNSRTKPCLLTCYSVSSLNFTQIIEKELNQDQVSNNLKHLFYRFALARV